MEKIAQTGAVTLKHAGRSMMVESREDGPADIEVVADNSDRPSAPSESKAPTGLGPNGDDHDESMPASSLSMQDGVRALQQAISQAPTPPRWPMYVRQAKQFLRNAIEGFDERKYGFVSVVDLLRAAGKEGVLRIERDRQGAVRVFPGPNVNTRAEAPPPPVDLDETVDVEVPAESIVAPPDIVDVIEEAPPIEEAVIIDEDPADAQPPNVSNESAPLHMPRGRRTSRSRKTTATRSSRESSSTRTQKE